MAPIAPLAWFRIVFGALMVAEAWGAIATGWVAETFVEPRVTFPMAGLEGLRVLSGPWMYAYFAVMGLAALGTAAGWRYRASAALLALMWTGVYLAQKSHYNNHYYLAALVAWWMAALPAHRARSLDVCAGRVARASRVDRWVGRLFRVELLIVFTFAAVAKLYPGWLNGEYLRANLGTKGDQWPLGPLLVQEWFQRVVAFTAIGFDALVVPALMWRRTRALAVAGLVVFNLFNSVVFRIGIFPYMVLGWTVFFFDDRFGGEEGRDGDGGEVARRPWLRPAAVLFLAVQAVLPLRHHLIPGDVTWTEDGHRLSWRMMLRTKSGVVTLLARSPSAQRTWFIDQSEWLTTQQQNKVATNPEFLRQFVDVLRREIERAEGIRDLEIYAKGSRVSLNGTETRRLYDPDVDLCREPWHPWLARERWVLDRGAP